MKIQVCIGKFCRGKFSEYIIKRINEDIIKFNLNDISVETCGCVGDCENGPNVIIDGEKENFSDPAKISRIMLEKIDQRKKKSKESEEKDKKAAQKNNLKR